MDNKTAVVIVKVFAVLAFIGAAMGIIGGLMTMVVGAAFGSMLGPIGAAVGGFAGIFMIAFGVLAIFVGIGLWKHKNWARIVTLVFAVLGALSSLVTLPASIVPLIICGVEIWLFGFEKTVKSLFS